MKIASETLAPPTSADLEMIKRAFALINEFPQCFWHWQPEERACNSKNLRLVVECLRGYGDSQAWLAAQDLHKRLTPCLQN